jgi:hypothetical protein
MDAAQPMNDAISPHAYDYEDIGGIVAKFLDGKIVDWNTDVPGIWIGPHKLAKIGSYVSSYCKSLPGANRA